MALRDAMDVEMDALYSDPPMPVTAEPLPDGMFDVDPAEVLVTVLVTDGDRAVGHAALRPHRDALEVKKVFVDPTHRGRGIARMLMAALEDVAREHGILRLVLQTGDRQVEAIGLYERIGYTPIPPFRNYGLLPATRCFAKTLTPSATA